MSLKEPTSILLAHLQLQLANSFAHCSFLINILHTSMTLLFLIDVTSSFNSLLWLSFLLALDQPTCAPHHITKATGIIFVENTSPLMFTSFTMNTGMLGNTISDLAHVRYWVLDIKECITWKDGRVLHPFCTSKCILSLATRNRGSIASKQPLVFSNQLQ